MKTFLTVMLVTVLGFAVHALGEAVAARLLGESVIVTINGVEPARGSYGSRGVAMVVGIAGPLVTLALALIGAAVARITGSLLAFWIVFSSLVQRTFAQAATLESPVGEMRVSLDLGLGPWTLPAAMVTLLLLFTLWATRRSRPSLSQLVLASAGAGGALALVAHGAPYLRELTW